MTDLNKILKKSSTLPVIINKIKKLFIYIKRHFGILRQLQALQLNEIQSNISRVYLGIYGNVIISWFQFQQSIQVQIFFFIFYFNIKGLLVFHCTFIVVYDQIKIEHIVYLTKIVIIDSRSQITRQISSILSIGSYWFQSNYSRTIDILKLHQFQIFCSDFQFFKMLNFHLRIDLLSQFLHIPINTVDVIPHLFIK